MCASGLLTGVACAQETLDFRTPDGSRVVLIATPGPALVHWAVATPCGPEVDPPSAPGTAAAAMLASLRGTWRNGSKDAAAEQAALSALDAAETDLALVPRSAGAAPELVAKVEELRARAAALCDPLEFRRVLAATPAQDVHVEVDGNTATLRLTTAPFAVPAIARLLRERREQQALRSVREELQQVQDRALAAWDRDPLAPLWAEVLALSFSGHAIARMSDRPIVASFQRALAVATWARAQHPARTVHVLVGNFDAPAVRTALAAEFATTALPPQEPLGPAIARPQQAVRRSLVPGAHHPAAVLAFPVPAGTDPDAAATAALWFAGGEGSWLHTELVRLGRKKAQVRVRAPWPRGAASALLAIEVRDAAGTAATIADDVLQLCAPAVAKAPRQGDLPRAFGTVLREFELATRHPAAQAAHFGALLLQQPGLGVERLQPREVAFAQLPQLLERILTNHPIVIEWRDA